MTIRRQCAGLLALMLIGGALPFAAPPDHGASFVAWHVWSASVPLAVFTIGVPPWAWALDGLPKAWPVVPMAGFAGWLFWARIARRRRIVVCCAAPDMTPSQAGPDPAAEPLSPSPAAMTPTAHEPAQGADLAARARYVALTFAFPAPGPSRPAPTGWPLHVHCQPTRFILTLQHAALGYRLALSNRGAEPLGPLIIRADLVAATGRLVHHRQTEFAADALPPCHYLDALPAGETIELAGEVRLPLTGICAMRLGTAELLAPLMRLCVTSAGDAQPALIVSAGFAVGLPPLAAGGGIQPFRLDRGPAIWRKLTARRLRSANMS